MKQVISELHSLVWGLPTVVLILTVGIYFSIRTKFFQIRRFPLAIKQLMDSFRKKDYAEGEVTPYQALCTALAATVGTGNIVGVAGAISIGGPGAVFWLWICAFLGMIIKCCEAVLAVRYRKRGDDGEYHGGPMYMIRYGMGPRWKWLAGFYAFFGVIAAFGVGNATQIDAVLGGIRTTFEGFSVSLPYWTDLIIACILAALVAAMQLGGAKRIGRITEGLVPFASAIYIILGLGILLVNLQNIPQAFSMIFEGVFTPKAVTGGAVGSIWIVCRTGAARGVFTNEAGMGTASIAHASANVKDSMQQGMMGIIEVFLDTLVICTITALAILCSGVTVPYGTDAGVGLTMRAFSSIYGNWASVFLSVCLILFALATVVGWGFYGLRCAQYLLGYEVKNWFIALQVVTVIVCAILDTKLIWQMAEIMNGLMSVPNLIALFYLRHEFVKITGAYDRKRENGTQ